MNPQDLRAELASVVGQLRADIDTMQDVYLTTEQRAAFDRIVAVASEHGGGGEAFGWWCANTGRFYRADEWGNAPCDQCVALYTTPQPRGEGMVLDAMERAAEEIEQGHAWITAVAASKIIRKHAAMLAAAPGEWNN